ncbi:MAG: DUF1289 domain-containing protein [Sphingomonas sp.]|nr:DUF1289 domain-containing protein [Sphingomonas sp.]
MAGTPAIVTFVPPVAIESPCVQVCEIDRPSGLCIGCGRTLAEIGVWSRATPEWRAAVMASLDARRASLGRSSA